MRIQSTDRIIAEGHVSSDELLTTGEAARILNSSRQHVVDLCNRGDLPFVTTGSHRRVRRADVEQIKNRSLRLTRDQRRSLWLAYAVAGQITIDPVGAIRLASENLLAMRSKARGQAALWLNEWERLLDGDITELLAVLTSSMPRGRDLRQNSPFAGLLSEAVRLEALAAWQENEVSGSALET